MYHHRLLFVSTTRGYFFTYDKELSGDKFFFLQKTKDTRCLKDFIQAEGCEFDMRRQTKKYIFITEKQKTILEILLDAGPPNNMIS